MRRRSFLSAVLALGAGGGVAPAFGAKRATPAPTPEPLRVGSFRGVLIRPSRPNGTGVLLQPTIAAINPFMIGVAREFAALGYAAVIWDPYRGDAAPSGTAGQLARSKAIGDDDAMADLRHAVDHMTGPLRLRAVATIGWCLGGRYALLQGGLDRRVAAISAYNPTIYSATPVPLYGTPTSKADFPGQTMDDFAVIGRIACPVQIQRPGKDLAQPAEYARLEQVLFARGAPTQIGYFPHAEHGFSYKLDDPANREANRFALPATLAFFGSAMA